MSNDGEDGVPERLFIDGDAPPIDEVTAQIPNAGTGELELFGGRDTVDVTVQPIREDSVDEDVAIGFTLGATGTASVSLPEDEALAVVDSIQQALEVESYE
ncbi:MULTISPECIES: hypothetical protein [Haloarcula]|uniref:hypothetical protein n=1 Tax=Haloarcula TaxID=2237 RepID=UPI000F8DFED3|nr:MULTISPECIES: hypothetical protein [Haloarcula]NHX42005.1 hypothetical protein [Haloarcula sp. R1-2]